MARKIQNFGCGRLFEQIWLRLPREGDGVMLNVTMKTTFLLVFMCVFILQSCSDQQVCDICSKRGYEIGVSQGIASGKASGYEEGYSAGRRDAFFKSFPGQSEMNTGEFKEFDFASIYSGVISSVVCIFYIIFDKFRYSFVSRWLVLREGAPFMLNFAALLFSIVVFLTVFRDIKLFDVFLPKLFELAKYGSSYPLIFKIFVGMSVASLAVVIEKFVICRNSFNTDALAVFICAFTLLLYSPIVAYFFQFGARNLLILKEFYYGINFGLVGYILIHFIMKVRKLR